MGWVTLEDGQHVLIGPSGRVLATRAQTSSASGAKERGKALAGRSKGAVARAVAKARTSKAKPSLREQAEKARAAKGNKEDRTAKILARSAQIHSAVQKRSLDDNSRGAYERARPRLESLSDRMRPLIAWRRSKGLRSR